MKRPVLLVALALAACGGGDTGPADPGAIYTVVNLGGSCGQGGYCTLIAEAHVAGGGPAAEAWTGYDSTGTTYPNVDERTTLTGQFVVRAFANDPGDSVWVCAAERRGCRARTDGLLVVSIE